MDGNLSLFKLCQSHQPVAGEANFPIISILSTLTPGGEIMTARGIDMLQLTTTTLHIYILI